MTWKNNLNYYLIQIIINKFKMSQLTSGIMIKQAPLFTPISDQNSKNTTDMERKSDYTELNKLMSQIKPESTFVAPVIETESANSTESGESVESLKITKPELSIFETKFKLPSGSILPTNVIDGLEVGYATQRCLQRMYTLSENMFNPDIFEHIEYLNLTLGLNRDLAEARSHIHIAGVSRLVPKEIFYRRKVVLKTFNLAHAEHELQALTRLKDCPYVLNYYGWVAGGFFMLPEGEMEFRYLSYTQPMATLVLEYAEEGDLFALVTKYPTGVPNNLAQHIMKQLCLAVQECHRKNIIHRDIKPANIFITSNYDIRLADFDHWCEPGLAHVRCSGTLEYASPESMIRRMYETTHDIWCMGLVMYNMLSGGYSLNEMQADMNMKSFNIYKMMKAVFLNRQLKYTKNSIDPMVVRRIHNVSAMSANLIQWMVRHNYRLRPSIQEILCHPWFDAVN